jgi:mannobiose 2-epimerase
MKNSIRFLFFFPVLIVLFSCSGTDQQKKSTSYSAMEDTLEVSLFKDIVNVWYPRIIDKKYGGYITNFSYDWTQQPDQDKYLVYQARHIWTLSLLYKNYPDRNEFLEYAKHGFDFLTQKMWDNEYGGFYLAVDEAGTPLQVYLHEKRIYGEAFAIYALAEYYSVTQDENVLEWAKKLFNWMEENSHDPVNGGYFEFIHRDGSPVLKTEEYHTDLNDSIVVGLKDYNSSIHLLEAITNLYNVWPDDLVRERLDEMFHIIRDTMITDPGYLLLYFEPDWKLVTGETLDNMAGRQSWYMNHVTFGHDIETSYLLYEAAEALHNHDDKTTRIIKQLTDHALKKGWDEQNGGLYDAGKYITPDSLIIIDKRKAWWGEIEALNSMLLLHSLYPDDAMDYYGYFLKQWDYINTYLIDHTYGGWYSGGIDIEPNIKLGRKAHAWKTTYHNTRGMVNCINRLRQLEQSGSN